MYFPGVSRGYLSFNVRQLAKRTKRPTKVFTNRKNSRQVNTSARAVKENGQTKVGLQMMMMSTVQCNHVFKTVKIASPTITLFV